MMQLEVWSGVLLRYRGGVRRAEQVMRPELPSGKVQYFEGAHGDERLVRPELPSGKVQYFEGAHGDERVVSEDFVRSRVASFGGVEKGGGVCLGAYDGFLERSVHYGRPKGLPRFAEAHIEMQKARVIEAYLAESQGLWEGKHAGRADNPGGDQARARRSAFK